jgi:D-xylose transport system substrate-binding protein
MQHLITLTLMITVLAACAAPAVEPRGKIALLLPETKTTRYESHDLPNFRAQLQARGFDVGANLIYSNANQDAAAQQRQAEAALTNGARVLVLDPVDSNSATAIAELARARGVPVIAYDRLITGSDAVDYYVSFNNRQVGHLQAEALLAALADIPLPTIVMLNGSPLDNNTVGYKEGAHAVLANQVVIAKEYDIPDWSPDKAQEFMAQALIALGNRVDGVYVANDGMAGGAIAAMKAAGLDPLPPVTGQDAELAAIQRILVGEQHMTVYKAIQHEAAAAADLAYTLWQGRLPDPALFNTHVDNGRIQVPAILLTPIGVTRANVHATIFADNFWEVADVCVGEYAQACLRAGIDLSQTEP